MDRGHPVRPWHRLPADVVARPSRPCPASRRGRRPTGWKPVARHGLEGHATSGRGARVSLVGLLLNGQGRPSRAALFQRFCLRRGGLFAGARVITRTGQARRSQLCEPPTLSINITHRSPPFHYWVWAFQGSDHVPERPICTCPRPGNLIRRNYLRTHQVYPMILTRQLSC